VRIIKSLQILLLVATAGGVSEAIVSQASQAIVSQAIVSQAMAQGRPSVSLFGAAPIDAPQGEIRGMRPETVGEVAYFSLAIDAPSKLRGLADAPQQVKIALPGGSSVTCMLRSQARPGGMLLLSGAPEDGAPGQHCILVVDNGQVTGELELTTGRYRIQPLGNGSTHVVVEVKTAAFPSENAPKSPPASPPASAPR